MAVLNTLTMWIKLCNMRNGNGDPFVHCLALSILRRACQCQKSLAGPSKQLQENTHLVVQTGREVSPVQHSSCSSSTTLSNQQNSATHQPQHAATTPVQKSKSITCLPPLSKSPAPPIPCHGTAIRSLGWHMLLCSGCLAGADAFVLECTYPAVAALNTVTCLARERVGKPASAAYAQAYTSKGRCADGCSL